MTAITDITYTATPARLGRGRKGYFTQTGIEIFWQNRVSPEGGFDILLTPINSKGPSEAARLVIPGEDLNFFIKQLQAAQAQREEPAKPLKMGRVFYSGSERFEGFGGLGWYYEIDMAEPVGPFDTQLEAGKAARATIVAE